MAFTVLDTKPNDALLCRQEQLTHMTDSQFVDELEFWDKFRSQNRARRAIATTMLRSVMKPVDRVRGAYGIFDHLQSDLQDEIRRIAPDALAGLALSQFLRRTLGDGFALLPPGSHPPGIDLVLGQGRAPIALVHEAHADIGKLVPPPGMGTPSTWYEDEALFVEARMPAKVSTHFSAAYQNKSSGLLFPSHRSVTLEPHLKAAFVGQ